MNRFVNIDRDTHYLLPPSVDDWLPKEHLARFVVEVIDQLDLSALTRQYAGRGSGAHHPAVLLGLLVYGYASGVHSEETNMSEVDVRYRKLVDAHRAYVDVPSPTTVAPLELLATEGDVQAMNMAGYAYAYGVGVVIDEERAIRWFSRALANGSVDASFRLGRLLSERGEYAGAAEALQFGADNEFAPALYRLGVLSIKGHLGDQSRLTGVIHLQKASAMGHPFAMRELGLLYLKGDYGLATRVHGAFLLLAAFGRVIVVGLKDPHGDLTRG